MKILGLSLTIILAVHAPLIIAAAASSRLRIPLNLTLQDTTLQAGRSPPADPWTYHGPKGLYTLSKYHQPRIPSAWLATFLVTCMGDVFDSIAEQGFQPNQPYPDGRFDCDLEYSFPTGELVGFGLVLGMATGSSPEWKMTFQDVMADLEALWYAALWFDPLVFPESEVQIKKCTQPGGPTGPCPLRLVEEGRFIFTPGVRAGNGSVDTA